MDVKDLVPGEAYRFGSSVNKYYFVGTSRTGKPIFEFLEYDDPRVLVKSTDFVKHLKPWREFRRHEKWHNLHINSDEATILLSAKGYDSKEQAIENRCRRGVNYIGITKVIWEEGQEDIS